jgi:hypothetical protein
MSRLLWEISQALSPKSPSFFLIATLQSTSAPVPFSYHLCSGSTPCPEATFSHFSPNSGFIGLPCQLTFPTWVPKIPSLARGPELLASVPPSSTHLVRQVSHQGLFLIYPPLSIQHRGLHLLCSLSHPMSNKSTIGLTFLILEAIGDPNSYWGLSSDWNRKVSQNTCPVYNFIKLITSFIKCLLYAGYWVGCFYMLSLALTHTYPHPRVDSSILHWEK